MLGFEVAKIKTQFSRCSFLREIDLVLTFTNPRKLRTPPAFLGSLVLTNASVFPSPLFDDR